MRDNSELVLRALLQGMDVEVGDETWKLGPALTFQVWRMEEEPVHVKVGCDISSFICMCRLNLTQAQRGEIVNELKKKKKYRF